MLLSVGIQIFATLRYLATGSFQEVTAYLHGISKPSVYRSVHAVCTSFCNYVDQWIKFPGTDRDIHVRQTKQGFFELCGIPNVLGAIDGTLIPIKRPEIDEHLYVCHQGYHAINVQAVCDSRLEFTDVVVRYPGIVKVSLTIVIA